MQTLKISDAKLADHCQVTREYMCKVRNGKRQGSIELEGKLQELFDSAKQHGFFHQQEKPIIVESTPIAAPVPYEPRESNVISPIVHAPTVAPVEPQPAKRKWPLSIAELDARNEARKKAHTPLAMPVQPQPVKRLLPLNVRRRLISEWRWACRCSKRRGLPKPPKPNMFEETRTPEVTRVPTVNPIEIDPISYLSGSEYRSF